MHRRKYLAAFGIGAAAVLAGCGGGSNSSGEDSGNGTTASGGETPAGESTTAGGGGGTESDAETDTITAGVTETEAPTAAAETPAETGTEAPTETITETSAETATPTSSATGTKTGTQAVTMTQTEASGGGDNGPSGSVSLDEQDIVDGVELDSSEWYNEDDGFSTGVRGQLTASQEFDFLFINAQIYGSDDTRIGEGGDSSESIPSGETLTFDCIMAPSDPSAVASYNIQVSPNA